LIVGIAFSHPSFESRVPQASFRHSSTFRLRLRLRPSAFVFTSDLIGPDPAGQQPTAAAFDRPSPDRPNAQNGGTPSAPGAVGAHPFQTITQTQALRDHHLKSDRRCQKQRLSFIPRGW
jgi:hypothetical protein